MTLFESLLEQLLGPGTSVSVARGAAGHPVVRLSREDAAIGGSLVLEPGSLVLDGIDAGAEDAIVDVLGPHGHRLRRIHDYLDRFPVTVERDAASATVSLAPPRTGALWSDDGLSAEVCVTISEGGQITDIRAVETVVATRTSLDADGWDERLAAFDARCAGWAEASPDLLWPDQAPLEIVVPPVAEDDGWAAYADRLRLDAEGVRRRVAPAVAGAWEALGAVQARYEEVYGLKLPSGIALLAALVGALGELPENPEQHYSDPAPGRLRGGAWLDTALGMRVTGLTAWFAPGGLARRTLDAAIFYEVVPAGREGRLDPRLDWRFRCDARQFVTFLGGDSDGLHWGFWYDSPDHFPIVAHNYARDSAETWLDEGATIGPWLRARLAKALDQAKDDLVARSDEELRGYALRRWRALRVVEAHFEAIEVEAPPAADEPLCPWPRGSLNPVGSPPLALPPGAGNGPYPWTDALDKPSVERFRSWIDLARRELAAGHPAAAHTLGLYLHWGDADDLREEAGALLLSAYEALGFRPFAHILRAHLQHRDLPTVAVFEEERGS
jgi:hypothetical protein